MDYPRRFGAPDEVPRGHLPLLQHLVDTYASKINKAASVWRAARRPWPPGLALRLLLDPVPPTYGPTADVT